jgi:hypothetical protein
VALGVEIVGALALWPRLLGPARISTTKFTSRR